LAMMTVKTDVLHRHYVGLNEGDMAGQMTHDCQCGQAAFGSAVLGFVDDAA